ETRGVRILNVDEVERRCPFGQRGGELPAQVAVDQGERDEQRKTEAEREHHGRRERARPVNVGDDEAQESRARPRCAPRQRISANATRRNVTNTTTAAPTKMTAIMRS